LLGKALFKAGKKNHIVLMNYLLENHLSRISLAYRYAFYCTPGAENAGLSFDSLIDTCWAKPVAAFLNCFSARKAVNQADLLDNGLVDLSQANQVAPRPFSRSKR
jgi:hypothetical protein